MQETRALASSTHTLQEEHRLLSTRTNESLDQVVANNQILLRRSAVSEQAAHEVRATTNLTQDTVASLSMDLVNCFENLPTVLAPIIENSIAQCLAKHDALGSTATPSTSKTFMSHKVCEGVSGNKDTCSLPVRTSSDTALPPTEGPSSEISSDLPLQRKRFPLEASNFLQSERLNKRSPKRQRTKSSVFNLWFAQLTVTTSQTEQEDDPGSAYLPPMHLQAKRTTLRLIPSLQFLRIGFWYESGQSLPTISHPGWDNRMRVFRTHPWHSPVQEIISNLDLFRFRQLLKRREITPFDCIERRSGGSESLFENLMCTIAKPGFYNSLETRKRGLDFARLLADSGVDCGSGISLYWFLTRTVDKSDEAATDLSMSLFRITITHSQSDPFYGLMTMMNKNSFFTDDFAFLLIGKQDIWDISEFKTSYEQYKGKGCFQYIVENGASYSDWSGFQEHRWRCEPASSRTSKSHCLAEYGETFVKYHWPVLCWSEERPTFWQSRETCEEVFGKRFVVHTWPRLYWAEELPSFWSSRSTCLGVFGNFFVEQEWPPWLGKSCYEFLEGKGSWQRPKGFFPEHEHGSRWVAQMTDCWWEDDAVLRHSRQHCLDQYGVNWVQETLPTLLRQDGLPEEDVIRFTRYGQDMEPPAPCPDLAWLRKYCSIEGVEWVTQESEHDSDSSGEDSEDWETAGEDEA